MAPGAPQQCCCDVGCPDTLDITFAGVDAAACLGCTPHPLNDDIELVSLTIDGTYTLTKYFDNGVTCGYRRLASGAPQRTIRRYAYDSGCTGEYSEETIAAVITIALVAGSITSILVSGGALEPFNTTFSTTTPAPLGDSMPNEQTCAGQGASDGGTAVVTT